MGPSNNTNPSQLPFIMNYEPNPTSVQNMAHWSQIVATDLWQMFDYGSSAANMQHYNQVAWTDRRAHRRSTTLAPSLLTSRSPGSLAVRTTWPTPRMRRTRSRSYQRRLSSLTIRPRTRTPISSGLKMRLLIFTSRPFSLWKACCTSNSLKWERLYKLGSVWLPFTQGLVIIWIQGG